MNRILLLLFFIPNICFAGNENDPVGARAAGMGYAALGLQDIWSMYHNQAGIAHIETFSAGAFVENKFLVKEFAYSGFAAANPLGAGTIGITYANFGFSSYREGKLGLAYGLKITSALSMGVQLNYHTLNINNENYGRNGALTGELGLQMQVSEKVSVAAHIFNPTRARLNDFNDERLPTVLRLGSTYRISEDLIFAGEAEKGIDTKALFRGGIEYQPAEMIYLRVGASSAPALFTFGLGFKFKSFHFDIANTYHSVLGSSPQVSLTYAPGKK